MTKWDVTLEGVPIQFDNIVERVKIGGVKGASPADLIAIGFSRRFEDVELAEPMAREVLKRYGSIAKVANISPAEMHSHAGMEDFEALRAQCLIELGRRAGLAEKGVAPEIEGPEDVYELVGHLKYEPQEHFAVVLLNAKNKVIGWQVVHVGTLTMSIVGPREVFRYAVREGASSVIVVHNHPSGDPTPSPEDLEVTRKLVEVGRSLDIPVVDHIILGDPHTVSFARRGLI